MATPSDYLDTVDLKAIAANGFVNEEVMQKIQDASEEVRPIFLDLLATHVCKNDYTEWPEDELAAPDLTNAVVSGADASVSAQSLSNAKRVGNHTQISRKVVAATTRAQNVSAVGMNDALGYLTMRRLLELKRDVEAIALSNQASVADDNNATAGKSAGLGAWIKTHSYSGTSGAAGGFNTGTKLVAAPTAGEARACTLTLIRTAVQDLYEEGANPTVLMSTPAMIKKISEALRTSGANLASPTANISGGKPVIQVAQGWTEKWITDFGIVLQLVPNRLQQVYDSADVGPIDVANVYVLDPNYLAKAYLQDYKVEPLAKIGLSDRRQLSVDWTLKVLLERAQAVIRDCDPTQTVTA